MVYQGSHALKFVADTVGLPLDQFNFLVVQFVALISGFLFRRYMRPCPKNTLKRHLVAILWGILLGHFCFGRQMWHLFCQAFVAYLLLMFVPRKYVHLAVFFFSMAYLSGLHIYRMIYDYGNYTLDITSPFMVTTQKLTAFAFAYYDGMKKLEKLSADQKGQAINRLPHIIEFLSYIFNFQGIIVGPLSFYQDYIDFITGNNILKHERKFDSGDDEASKNIIVQPSNTVPILKKLCTLIIVAIIFFKLAIAYPMTSNLNEDILERPLWYRLIYLYVSVTSQRSRYYIAWTLAEMVNNASGFGFNGYDENGKAKWDLLTNVHILKFELATSIKMGLDTWNIGTQVWLRRICFDRLPTLKTLGVFVLSAFWHGFYPGYYFTFVIAAFGVYAGRGIRRKIRPFFQTNQILRIFYSIITWMGTALFLNMVVAPFDLIEFDKCMKYFGSWYWSVPLFCVIATIVLPGGSNKNHPAKAAEKQTVENETKTTEDESIEEEYLLNKDE